MPRISSLAVKPTVKQIALMVAAALHQLFPSQPKLVQLGDEQLTEEQEAAVAAVVASCRDDVSDD